MLNGLPGYSTLLEWFPLVSFCESKPVSHVCYCLDHDSRKSDFCKAWYKNDG